jgi:hypothetical protein
MGRPEWTGGIPTSGVENPIEMGSHADWNGETTKAED